MPGAASALEEHDSLREAGKRAAGEQEAWVSWSLGPRIPPRQDVPLLRLR